MIKKETLEEVAEREYPKEGEDSTYCDLGLIQQDAFKFGIKWLQERSYSEEEVKAILFHRETHYMQTGHQLHIDNWFEQFKKK